MLLKRFFLGAFPADVTPSNIKNVCCWIWNMDEQNDDGQHWVAIWKKNNVLYYFDSYGKNPDFYKREYWIDFARRINCKFIQYSDIQYQSMISKTCGAWSLLFLYHMGDKKKNYFNIFNPPTNLIKNEGKLRTTVFNIFNKIEGVYRKKCRKLKKKNKKCHAPIEFTHNLM